MGLESKCPCPNSAPWHKVVWSQANDLTSLNFSQFRNRIIIFPVWTAVKMKWDSLQRSLVSYPALWKCSGNISWNIHLSYLKQRRRQWHPTPILLPGKSHGRRSLVGCGPWGHDWATSLSLSCIREGNGNPLQCSCLENPRDGGAWWAAIYGVTQGRTRLKWLGSSRLISKLTVIPLRGLAN